MVETYQQFIGGDFVDSASGQTLDVRNPARDELIARVPASAKEDVDRAAVAKALEFGTVWINEHFTLTSETPHGGVKQSGWGKDGPMYALEDYTIVKNVMINSGV